LQCHSLPLSRCSYGFHCWGFAAADVLLWKDRNLSAGVLAGATLIWFLFDVVEYNIVPLLCQIAIFTMLVIFIASNAAPLFDMYGSLFLYRDIGIFLA
jgi:hypothetical protein